MKYEHRTAEQAGTRTYADGSGNTLILLDFLALLDFGPSRVVDLLHPHVFLAATELRCVHCDEKTLDATLLGMLHVFLRDLPIAVNVELQEEDLVVRHGEVRFFGVATVSAPTLRDLAANETQLMHGAAHSKVELRVLYGQQYPGFLTGGVPLGRGLAKRNLPWGGK